MIEEFLHTIGVPGQWVLLATVAYTLWHFRHAIHVAATIGTVLKVGMVFAFLGVVGMTGIIPGYRVELDWDVLWKGASEFGARIVEFSPVLI